MSTLYILSETELLQKICEFCTALVQDACTLRIPPYLNTPGAQEGFLITTKVKGWPKRVNAHNIYMCVFRTSEAMALAQRMKPNESDPSDSSGDSRRKSSFSSQIGHKCLSNLSLSRHPINQPFAAQVARRVTFELEGT